MAKYELLKKIVADVCGNDDNNRSIYEADDCIFLVDKQGIYVLYSYDGGDLGELQCFTPEFTDEEFQEVKKIKNELHLNYEIYLPIAGGVAYDLESLMDYYKDNGDCEAKTEEISKLIEALNKNDTLFYKREQKFIDIFLNPELESGIVYACSEWDHDEAYYLELPFSTGVKEPLYEIIENEPSIIFPDIIEDWENEEEFDYSEECEYWIGVLSDLDKYLFAKNQIERNAG